jgi:two-component system OmpR family response regulator
MGAGAHVTQVLLVEDEPRLAEIVRRGDTALTLTPREFALLEYLMRHKGIIVPKTQLLTEVWDTHWHGPPNVVEVYIGYLRKKIDTPFGTTSIETHRGIGYRLIDV